LRSFSVAVAEPGAAEERAALPAAAAVAVEDSVPAWIGFGLGFGFGLGLEFGLGLGLGLGPGLTFIAAGVVAERPCASGSQSASRGRLLWPLRLQRAHRSKSQPRQARRSCSSK